MLALLDGCENTRANAYRHLPLTIGSKRLYTLESEATRLGHYHSVVHLPTQSISSKNLVKVNNAKELLWLILSSLAKNKTSSMAHLYKNMLLLRCTSVVHIGLSNVRRQPVKLEFTIE
ncbi:hypothetical protein T09_1553 [Trichinella sp. T9]|nr:hypothetical protein T09_1553 [Trichinella sp. T9]